MSETLTATKPASTQAVVINFAAAEQPTFRETRNGRLVMFGKSHDYPAYLQHLFDTSTKHGSIIKGKVTYITGNGWAVKDGATDAGATAFITKLNRYDESLHAINKKATLDLEIFGGFYLQIIWSNDGARIAEVYHLDYTRMCSNADNTQFTYREDWKSMRKGQEEKIYPAFNPGNRRGSQVLYVKEYRPGVKTYAMPGYLQGMDWINADVEVGRHTYSNSQAGFTPSKAITMINGEPTEEEKKELTKRMQKVWSGADGKKFIIFFTNGAEFKPQIDDLGASDLTKEDFSQVDTLIQTNVFSCHQITTPALFGISTPGALGQSKELRDGYEIFKKTYVNDKQQFLEEVFNKLASYAGVGSKLFIIPTEPLGIEFSESTIKEIAPKAWILDQLGIDSKKYPADDQAAQLNQSAGAAVNEHLKNLSGRQMQAMQRIVRQYNTGKMTYDQAAQMLKSSLGLTDEDVKTWLVNDEPDTNDQAAQQFSEEEDDDAAILVFAEFGSARANHRILKTRRAKFSADSDVEVLEHAFLSFADEAISKLQASILDLINKDKLITPEVIATTLAVDVADVNASIADLIDRGALKVTSDNGQEERTLTKPVKDLQEGIKPKTQAYQVKYSYDGPQDSKNRPFCAKLMALDRLYTRKEIESISERLGYSVWDRRGGWYTVPGTNTHRPYCRHQWMSNVVITDQQ